MSKPVWNRLEGKFIRGKEDATPQKQWEAQQKKWWEPVQCRARDLTQGYLSLFREVPPFKLYPTNMDKWGEERGMSKNKKRGWEVKAGEHKSSTTYTQK